MPKIVDHALRKLEIAEATWRVVKEKGIKGASARNIAQESGLSLGALRHYFPAQDDLLVFAMQVVKDRVMARIQRIPTLDLPPLQKVLSIFLELMPTDEEKRVEMEVWFEFTLHMKKMNLPAFDAQHDGIYELIEEVLSYLDELNLLRQGLNRSLEAERLYAVLDGLALHALLDASRLDSERIREVLQLQLASICKADAI